MSNFAPSEIDPVNIAFNVYDGLLDKGVIDPAPLTENIALATGWSAIRDFGGMPSSWRVDTLLNLGMDVAAFRDLPKHQRRDMLEVMRGVSYAMLEARQKKGAKS